MAAQCCVGFGVWRCFPLQASYIVSRAGAEVAIQRGKAGLASLLFCDQARAQQAAGAVFHGAREGALAFAPTYKFDKGSLGTYDSGEKQRTPAWTDRVFFKGGPHFAAIALQVATRTALQLCLTAMAEHLAEPALVAYSPAPVWNE